MIGGSPGTWNAVEGGIGFGTLTRAIRLGQFGNDWDLIYGDVGQLQARQFTGSGDGVQTSYATITGNTMTVGAWSNSDRGTARAIAFRTFLNNTDQTKIFKVKVVADGRFENGALRVTHWVSWY